MRTIATLFAISVVGSAFADDSALARELMIKALPKLRASGQVALELNGVHTQGRTRTDIRTTLAFWYGDISGRPTAKVEAMSWENGRLIARLVGDGQYFFAYDVRQNSYSSTRYGSVDTMGQRPDHLPLLCRNLRMRATGPLALTARLSSDIWERPASSWQAYIANSHIVVSDGVTDKIISAEAQSPFYSKTDYLVDQNFDLTEVNYYAHRTLGANDIIDDFVVTVYSGNLFTDTDFSFTPPAGSRATAVSESTGG